LYNWQHFSLKHMTTGEILDQPQHAQKTEPGFDNPETAPAMPPWLNQQAAPETWGQRWGRRGIFLVVALVCMAFAGGMTLAGLELYEAQRKPVLAAPAMVAPVAPALAQRQTTNLPPLVLLPKDPKAQPAVPATAVAAVPAPLVVPPPMPAPPVAKAAPIKPPVAKPPVKLAAQPPAKPKPVLAAKKPVVAPKPAPVLAKAAAPRPKPVKASAPAPRNKGRDPAFDDPPPPREAAERKCRPGELARECEARLR
jgi:hypothetical protein